MTFRGFDGDLVPRIRVSDHAHAWVGRQDSFQPFGGFGRSVRNDDLTCVLGISHTDAAAMMERHPCRSADSVDQCVEDRPISNRV